MKYVDTPPILAILFSKQQTPPQHLRTIQRDPPPPKLVGHTTKRLTSKKSPGIKAPGIKAPDKKARIMGKAP